MSGDAGASVPDVDEPASEKETTSGSARPLAWGPKLGIWAWSFVGVVVMVVIVVLALAAVSEIVLPLTFAAVLAVCFKPLADLLRRHGVSGSVAAALIVLLLLALTTIVVVATVRGVVQQTAQIGGSVDDAIAHLVAESDIDEGALDAARQAVEEAAPTVTGGVVTGLLEGVSTIVGLASGLILGALIMYYLLKDGTKLRDSVAALFDQDDTRTEIDGFISDSCRTLRDYGRGRTAMSAIVAVVIGLAALVLGLPLVFTIVVVNFVGGYIPYIGAFLGGGLAVIVALGEGGLPTATIMLIVVVASNLLLENFVEPRVMGRTLDIHPLVVLVVTALGGIVGGIVGLILAVPAWVVATEGLARLRRHGFFDRVVTRAKPAVQRMLQ
ncbi:AI-2E family transporter [Krasilnikoviella flava]|uniref:Predicted PurR-regulated permease PerM n=1 Tax=Krasilnikoviella flava TaxID=526729 RepID=A0A1T5KBH8_9MICO|nr:AI-2E family transporter [Krasilnikoviella flava]SKC61073.1 Predicted PurR-regulated permease PerM [Krasilnikoviella flava]